MRICPYCHYPISDTERTMKTLRGICCDICADKIDGLTPDESRDNYYTDPDTEEET